MTGDTSAPLEPARESPEPLVLARDERETVAAVAEAYAAALPAERAATYRSLAEAARTGTVPAQLIEVIERVCTLALETGKARELGRAEAERVLTVVFRRTPHGRALTEGAEAVNRALAALAGRRLRAIRVAMRAPGHYTLTLDVRGVGLTVVVGPGGIGVGSLAAG